MKTLLLALLLGVASLQAFAQSAAVVDGVQMPAWLERDGKRTPLAPGMELRAGDRVSTGDGSRVLLKLAEGSVVQARRERQAGVQRDAARQGPVQGHAADTGRRARRRRR